VKKYLLIIYFVCLYLILENVSYVLAATDFVLPEIINVADVNITGANDILISELKSVVKTHAGDVVPLNELDLRIADDIKGLRSTGEVVDVTFKLEPANVGVLFTYYVKEYPRISRIIIDGNTLLTDDEILPRLNFKTGDVFNKRILEQNLKEIADYYSSQGGAIAGTSWSIDDLGQLLVKIDEQKIGDITISGSRSTKDYVIKRQLLSVSGDPVDINKIRLDQQRLYQLGYFDDETALLEDTDGTGKSTYTITISEKPAIKFNTFAAYDVFNGFQGKFGFDNLNLFGNGQKLSAMVAMSTFCDDMYRVTLTEPRLNSKGSGLSLSAFKKTYHIPDGSGAGIELMLSDPVNAYFSTTLSVRADNSWGMKSPAITEGEVHSIRLSGQVDTIGNSTNIKDGYK
jgi:outer membrane protein insertion porin family